MSVFQTINIQDISDELILAPTGTTFSGTVKKVSSSSGVSEKSDPAVHWASVRLTVETSDADLMEVIQRDSAIFTLSLMLGLNNEGALELNDNVTLGALIKMFELNTDNIQEAANEAASAVEEPEEGGLQAASAKFVETLLTNLVGHQVVGTLGKDDYQGERNVVTAIVPTS